MTRKEALKQAITILSNSSENEEVCIVLQELYGEYPMKRWTEAAILDAFDQYILDHGHLPSVTTIKESPQLPKHSTIKNRFGMGMKEFFTQYYPDWISRCDSRVYFQYTSDELIRKFKSFYIENECRSMSAYDKIRPSDYPSGRHLLKLSRFKTWNEFLDSCGIPLRSQTKNSRIKPARHRQPLESHSLHREITQEKADEIIQCIARYTKKSVVNAAGS